MGALPPDQATVQALRTDVALQLARHMKRLGITQVAVARQLGLPQPTVSKILNGRVSDISLELLIRTAARAGLPMTLQTGRLPQEAGAYVTGAGSRGARASRSRLEEEAQAALNQSMSRLTPAERLTAFLEHNQFLAALHQAGRTAEAQRTRKVCDTP